MGSRTVLSADQTLKKFATKLNAASPTGKPSTMQRKAGGDLILDRCTIGSVNNTASAVVVGGVPVPAYMCQITYKSTVCSAPWIGSPPTAGEGMVLVQTPLLYVIGGPSNQTAGGSPVVAPGSVLSSHRYAPSTSTAGTNAFGGFAFAQLDPANLIVPTFTLPASGNVAVELQLGVASEGTTGAATIGVGLFDSSHVPVHYGDIVTYSLPAAGTGYTQTINPMFYVSGTPGAVIPELLVCGASTVAETVTVGVLVYSQSPAGSFTASSWAPNLPSGNPPGGVPFISRVTAL